MSTNPGRPTNRVARSDVDIDSSARCASTDATSERIGGVAASGVKRCHQSPLGRDARFTRKRFAAWALPGCQFHVRRNGSPCHQIPGFGWLRPRGRWHEGPWAENARAPSGEVQDDRGDADLHHLRRPANREGCVS